MSLTANLQSFLFLMGSLNDAAILDAAIESGHLEFQKLGILTYLGRLEESPGEFCNKLVHEGGIHGEVHWMRLPNPTAPLLEPEEDSAVREFVELEVPACFIVNH